MSATPYRFSRELVVEDMAFRSGPEPGSPLPAFDLLTVDGNV